MSARLDSLAAGVHDLSALAGRVARAQRPDLSRSQTPQEPPRRPRAEDFLERERKSLDLSREASETERALAAAAETAPARERGPGRRLQPPPTRPARQRPTRTVGCRSCERPSPPAGSGRRRSPAGWSDVATGEGDLTEVRRRPAPRGACRRISSRGSGSGGTACEGSRGRAADARREISNERTSLSRRAVDLAGELATARAHAERIAEEVSRAETSAAEAGEEIQSEWGATLEAAGLEARQARRKTRTKNATPSPASSSASGT